MADSYCSFGIHPVVLNKLVSGEGAVSYRIASTACIWKDQNTRNAGRTHLESVYVDATITSDQLASNPYTTLYAALKSKYISTTDC
jgi:hypothetical protein